MKIARSARFTPKTPEGTQGAEDEYDREMLTLHDRQAAPVEDPATAAARRFDCDMVGLNVDRTGRKLIALIEDQALALPG